MRSALAITSIPLPANSGHVLLVDSTRRLLGDTSTSAAAQIPGAYRASWVGARLTGTVTPTTQGVTVIYEILTNSAGIVAASFEQDTNAPGGGSQTVAAGVTQPFSWLPAAVDWRIRVTAGGTAPSALKASCVITWDRSSGA